MIFNIGDKKTKLLLSLAKTPLLFYPHYKYHLPLPSVLMIENTNHCNAECVMCPRDTLSRKRGFMDFGLFDKIITEVSSVRRKPVTHLHGFGEPLLDKLLAERIQLANTCGIKRTYIVTNASLLFPETSRKIISAGLAKMKISFYGTDEESYNNTMKRLNFKVTFQNIKDFLRIRKEMKSDNPRLILQYLPNETNNAKTAEFRSLWSCRFPKGFPQGFLKRIPPPLGRGRRFFSTRSCSGPQGSSPAFGGRRRGRRGPERLQERVR
jgi:hypothetical protein